ncbi:B-cell scaffold protein with ankyrin repeats, partial [Acanthisitta chloris]
DSEEEQPYTAVKLDESVYDFTLTEEEEKRKDCRSFIMKRLPAPAPHPICSLVRENTPYIVQASHPRDCRGCCDSTMLRCKRRISFCLLGTCGGRKVLGRKPCVLTEQQELIHLQKQTKKGAISVDETLDRFEQWQNGNLRLQSTQQEKVHHLRDTTIGKRQENGN